MADHLRAYLDEHGQPGAPRDHAWCVLAVEGYVGFGRQRRADTPTAVEMIELVTDRLLGVVRPERVTRHAPVVLADAPRQPPAETDTQAYARAALAGAASVAKGLQRQLDDVRTAVGVAWLRDGLSVADVVLLKTGWLERRMEQVEDDLDALVHVGSDSAGTVEAKMLRGDAPGLAWRGTGPTRHLALVALAEAVRAEVAELKRRVAALEAEVGT